MKIRTFSLLVGLIAITAFTLLNWSAIMMPTTLSLGVTTVQAPLGLLMLSLLILFTAVFLAFVLYSRASAYFRDSNHSMKMQALQELANNTETSRLTELRELLGEEFKKATDLQAESTEAVLARLEQLDRDIRTATKA